jgi:organic hydroperoxide reductase OsmC/OhrA
MNYETRLLWEGDTATYDGYSREYRVVIAGKPDVIGSADPAFRGDAARHNPEDMLMIAIASCHMLSYLALCARKRIRVVAYEDDARGRMVLRKDGGGHFEEVVLRPVVTIAEGDAALAEQLHEKAHHLCFIASSVNFPIRCEPTVRTR